MIHAIVQNLERGISLLNAISNDQYSNTTIAPYYSSIGSHMRHILDVFDCIFDGLTNKKVDLIARKRNLIIELKTDEGINYFNETISKLKQLNPNEFSNIIEVSDDLGNGIVIANYTIASVLIQAHSHAIHHFASIGYIISQLGIELPDVDFGFNPTTPKVKTI